MDLKIGAYKKDTWVEMELMESKISRLLKISGYDYNALDNVSLFKKSDEERLEEARTRLESADPRTALSDGVKYWCQRFKQAVKDKIYVSEMYLNDHGFFVSANLYLDKDFVMDGNPSGVEERYVERINKMTEEGYILKPCRHASGHYYEDCDTNRNLLCSYLKEFGAKSISFESAFGSLQKLTFYINPSKLVSANLPELYEDKDDEYASETLRDWEIKLVQKYMAEMKDAMSCATNGIISDNLGCAIVESTFFDISKVLHYKGEIYKTVTERHARSRKINQEIRDIEKSIGMRADPAEFVDTISEIEENLQKKVYLNTSFYLDNIRISEYGVVTMEMKWLGERGFMFHFHEKVNDEALSGILKISGKRSDRCGMRLIDDPENFATIAALMYDIIPGIDILTSESSVDGIHKFIKKLVVTAPIISILDK